MPEINEVLDAVEPETELTLYKNQNGDLLLLQYHEDVNDSTAYIIEDLEGQLVYPGGEEE